MYLMGLNCALKIVKIVIFKMYFNAIKTGKRNSDQTHIYSMSLCPAPPNIHLHSPMVPVSVQTQNPCTPRGPTDQSPASLTPSSSSMLDTSPPLCSTLAVPQPGMFSPDSRRALPATSKAHANPTSSESCSNDPMEPCPSTHSELPACFILLYFFFFWSSYQFQTYWIMYSSYISLTDPFHRNWI